MQQEITETLVSSKVAELAKKKGITEKPTFVYYIDKRTKGNPEIYFYEDLFTGDEGLYAYSQDHLQRILREVHNIHITIFSKSQESWMYRVTKKGQSLEEGLYGEDFYSHDKAREEALFQALILLPDVNI